MVYARLVCLGREARASQIYNTEGVRRARGHGAQPNEGLKRSKTMSRMALNGIRKTWEHAKNEDPYWIHDVHRWNNLFGMLNWMNERSGEWPYIGGGQHRATATAAMINISCGCTRSSFPRCDRGGSVHCAYALSCYWTEASSTESSFTLTRAQNIFNMINTMCFIGGGGGGDDGNVCPNSKVKASKCIPLVAFGADFTLSHNIFWFNEWALKPCKR